MKAHFLPRVILSLILLSSAAIAQTQSGFPQLPPVPQTGELKDKPDATHFWFIAAGDNRPPDEASPQPKTLTTIFKDAQRYHPAFFIWSGDIIYGHETAKDKLEPQYKEFFGIAASANVPVFNSPGNHEMDTVVDQDNEKIETPDAKLQEIYLKVMNFSDGAPPYGAFNYGNSRFIAVDTEETATSLTVRSAGKVVDDKGKKLKLDPGFVSDEQMELLKQDLDANTDKAHIFVFMHHPIIPANASSGLDKKKADELRALFKQYPNVSYVIAAHEHLYYNASSTALVPSARQDPTSSGPTYLVSGGAGARLDSCPASAGSSCRSFNHYLVFEVNSSVVKVQVVQVGSGPAKKKSSK